ncbi:condensation domain-containing protein [Micromonospora sp. URMC 106]|uniref:condensation domain-containing protein n=1 Tax=Micromonospora sp. URMC 106 TaxID=3423408 RepID=UPI003F1DDFB4
MTVAGRLRVPYASRFARAWPDGPPPDILPAASAQRRFFLIREVTGRNLVVPLSLTVRPGILDAETVRAALGRVVARHPALWCRVDEHRGVIVQARRPDPPCQVDEVTAGDDGQRTEAVRSAIARAERSDSGPVSARLIRGADADRLLFVFDHAVVDERSLRIFLSDFAAAADGQPRPVRPPSGWDEYRDAVRRHVDGESAAATPERLGYWVDRLRSVAARDTDDTGHQPGAPDTGSNVVPVDAVAVAPSLRPTLFPRLLAALHRALRDAGRPGPTSVGYAWGARGAGAEHLMGCFMNTTISVDEPDPAADPAAAWAPFLTRFWSDIEHAETPFDEVVLAVGDATRTGWSGNPDALLAFEDVSRRPVIRIRDTVAAEWLPPWLSPKAALGGTAQFDGAVVRPRLVHDPGRVPRSYATETAAAWRRRLHQVLPPERKGS